MSMAIKAIIRRDFLDCYSQLIAKDKNHQTVENDFKLIVLARLAKDKIINLPTLDLVHSWLDVRLLDLLNVDDRGTHLSHSKATPPVIRYVANPVAKKCHTVTALHWVLNQNLEIFSGFTDHQHFHSWLHDPTTNEIFEPTLVARKSYYGFNVTDTLEFVFGELDNVAALAEKKLILPAVYDAFLENVRQLVRKKQ